MMPEPTQLGLDGRETASTAPPVPVPVDAPRPLFDGGAFRAIRGQLTIAWQERPIRPQLERENRP